MVIFWSRRFQDIISFQSLQMYILKSRWCLIFMLRCFSPEVLSIILSTYYSDGSIQQKIGSWQEYNWWMRFSALSTFVIWIVISALGVRISRSVGVILTYLLLDGYLISRRTISTETIQSITDSMMTFFVWSWWSIFISVSVEYIITFLL